MNSAHDSRCSHRLGFPIRKSPDHRMLASPRGLSQLATSFFAFLRQGIPTHALSSLTIKFTHNTEQTHEPRGRVRGRQRIDERLSYYVRSPLAALIYVRPPSARHFTSSRFADRHELVQCPSIFNFQTTVAHPIGTTQVVA